VGNRMIMAQVIKKGIGRVLEDQAPENETPERRGEADV